MTSMLTRRWRACLAAAAVTAAVALAGCAGASSPAASSSAPASSPASAAAQHVTITGATALRFMPMTVHVRTGKVDITLKDMGAYPHNIVIPALGVTSKTVTGDPGSSSTSVMVTFPHPGRCAFHCQYHESAGMVGAFVVS